MAWQLGQKLRVWHENATLGSSVGIDEDDIKQVTDLIGKAIDLAHDKVFGAIGAVVEKALDLLLTLALKIFGQDAVDEIINILAPIVKLVNAPFAFIDAQTKMIFDKLKKLLGNSSLAVAFLGSVSKLIELVLLLKSAAKAVFGGMNNVIIKWKKWRRDRKNRKKPDRPNRTVEPGATTTTADIEAPDAPEGQGTAGGGRRDRDDTVAPEGTTGTGPDADPSVVTPEGTVAPTSPDKPRAKPDADAPVAPRDGARSAEAKRPPPKRVPTVFPKHRVKPRKGVKRQIEADAPRLPDGRFKNPHGPGPIEGKWDYGHRAEFQYKPWADEIEQLCFCK